MMVYARYYSSHFIIILKFKMEVDDLKPYIPQDQSQHYNCQSLVSGLYSLIKKDSQNNLVVANNKDWIREYIRCAAHCSSTVGKDLQLLLDLNKNVRADDPEVEPVDFKRALRYERVLPPTQDKALGQILQTALPVFQHQLWEQLTTTNRIKSYIGI